MAKKKTTRRAPQTSTPRMYSDGKPSQVAAGTMPASSARPAGGAAAAARGPVDLAKEYGYVAGDLKRLGIVAVALFTGLIALRLIIG
jgi:hypothetical protein